MLISKLKFVASNLRGPITNRKIIVFESDDWGTIRMTPQAKRRLSQLGIEDKNPFNRVDCLESSEDFEALFSVLAKYKDRKNHYPVITANTIMANPDFQKIEASGYHQYSYELFTDTYKHYWSQNKTFNSFLEGIREGFLKPQFHGREHVNIHQWLNALQSNKKEVRLAFKEQVFGMDFNLSDTKRNNFMAAYDFDSSIVSDTIHQTVREGLKLFRKVFGFSSTSTIAPAAVWHPDVEKIFKEEGVEVMQSYVIQHIPRPGENLFDKVYHYFGEPNKNGQHYITRNCYFEPATIENIDWVSKCLSQIRWAFLLGKPAIIATHRLNFSGGIDPTNRQSNLLKLDQLLSNILHKWPEVEFMSSDKLLSEMKIKINKRALV